jgi:hypothetical protein
MYLNLCNCSFLNYNTCAGICTHMRRIGGCYERARGPSGRSMPMMGIKIGFKIGAREPSFFKDSRIGSLAGLQERETLNMMDDSFPFHQMVQQSTTKDETNRPIPRERPKPRQDDARQDKTTEHGMLQEPTMSILEFCREIPSTLEKVYGV